MDKLASDYEQKATDRVGEFRDPTTDGFEDSNALKEAHVFAMLAVAAQLDKVEDTLHGMGLLHPDD